MKPVFEWVYAPEPRRPAAPARSGDGRISDRIEQAFDAASASTGTSFDYLLRTAQRESAMDPAARAPTSTATGLFQFTEGTWLETMKATGAAHGLGEVADRIEIGADGRPRVADPEDRRAILALRHDPEISAVMAGELTRRNGAVLTERLGRAPTEGELYIAHFLGARGAADLIGLAARSPATAAADVFPAQAAANRSVFYRDGAPLSAAAVYADLVATHGEDAVPAAAFETPITAFAAPDLAPDPLATASRVDAGWRAVEPDSAFASLFRTDRQAVPVGAVAGFWQGYSVAPALFSVAAEEDARALAAAGALPVPPARPAAPPIGAPGSGPLDLSAFLTPDAG